ncbi:MAG: DUF3488 and transglutaminase-like domain-containing protein [Phycisphaerae bacterium]|nr:DUF3488 and transglutaminase-like domain-containing protein [Phycisphaerae bacterium]
MPLRSFSEAEIALMARRRLERPLLATLWLGTLMLGLAEGNAFYAMAGTFAVAVNVLAVEQRREVYVHRLWVNIAVMAALAVLLLELRAPDVFLPGAMAHFMILMQVCKLFERKANRDYVQMLALSILTVVAAALFSQALWFVLLLVAYAALAAYSAMIMTIKRGLDSAAEARLMCETTPLSASRVAWNVIRDWPGGAVARKLVAVLAAMILTGVAVFFMAPREEFAGPSLLAKSTAISRAEYVRELRLGQPKKVRLSDKVVMRVTCDDGAGTLTGTEAYFRGKVMESYSQSGWYHTSGRPSSVQSPGETLLPGPAMRLMVMMDPGLLPDLFAPYPALQWETREGRLQLDSDMTAAFHRGVNIDRPFRYEACVLPDPLTKEQRAYLSVIDAPEDSYPPSSSVEVPQRVADLARQWCGDLLVARLLDPSGGGRMDQAIAQRIANRLRQDYPYSLDLSSANPDRDAVEDFLFHMKRGHCEYFASALTVMCRLLDVPARLVTGFLVHETDGSVGYYVVRGRDAHAWTEVYVTGTGWVTVDATPPGREELVRRGWWRRLDDFLSRLSFQWYNKVVGYDAVVQRRVWAQFVAALRRGWDSLGATAAMTGRSFANLVAYGYIDWAMVRVSIALGLMAAVVEVLLVLRIRRRQRLRSQAAEALAAQPWGALVFIPALLDRLERQRLGRRADRTAMETARQAQRQMRLPIGELEDLVAVYYRARWGGRRLADAEVAAARRRAEALSDLTSHSLRSRAGAVMR